MKTIIIKKEIAQQCESVLSSILGLAMHFIKNLRFNRKDPQQLYSVCLYSRLVELAYACKALMEKDTLIGIPIILRSMFEVDIDLTNLMKYPNYSSRMYATFLKQKLQAMKEAASDKPNPFLAEVKKHFDLKKNLKETQIELDNFIEQKNNPINTRCRAELADKLNEYVTVYNMLCLDTHNNISSLENWHIASNEQDDYEVVVFKLTKSDMIHHLSAIPSIIFSQTKSLANFLGIKGIEFKNYSREIKELRQAVEKSVKEE